MSSARDRQRNRRARLRAGRLVLQHVEADEIGLTEMLINHGLLDRADAEHLHKIEAAVERVLATLIAADQGVTP
jgi:hypothetical protein